MKLTDKRFWIAWGVLLVLLVGCCLSKGWREDTAMLGGAYALSLLSTWLCHKLRPRVAYGNLIVLIVYNIRGNNVHFLPLRTKIFFISFLPQSICRTYDFLDEKSRYPSVVNPTHAELSIPT